MISEADQLRQVRIVFLLSLRLMNVLPEEIHILEDNLDHSLSGEENVRVAQLSISTDNDTGSLQQRLQEQKVRFEVKQRLLVGYTI